MSRRLTFHPFSPDRHPDEVHRQRPRGAASSEGPGGSEGLHVTCAVAAEAQRQGWWTAATQTDQKQRGHVCAVYGQQRRKSLGMRKRLGGKIEFLVLLTWATCVPQPSKDYIGMVVKNNALYSVYKLNGVVHEIRTDSITSSDSEPAKFDKVNLHRWSGDRTSPFSAASLVGILISVHWWSRIYQDAEMVLVKDITSTTPKEPIVRTSQGTNEKNLLDLTPSDVVFYVGGYPSNFTVSSGRTRL